MAVGDKYSVILVANMDNVSIANCFFVDVIDDAGTADVPASISTHFQADIVSLIASQQSINLEYECLLIRKVSPVSEPAVVFTFTLAGTLTDISLPTNVALVVNTVSNDGRPRFRGRWFIAGLRETAVENGRWKQSISTLWDPLLVAITNSFGIAGETYILNHFSPHINQFDSITRGRLSPQPRKMRGRTPGICSIS